MFSFRNEVQEVKKAPRNVYVLTLTKMEGDADQYYHDTITYHGMDGINPQEMIEIISVLKALNQGQNITDLSRNPPLLEAMGISQDTVDRISDMVGYDDCGNRHKITKATMVFYDMFGNKFNGDFYMGEEKIFPMNIW